MRRLAIQLCILLTFSVSLASSCNGSSVKSEIRVDFEAQDLDFERLVSSISLLPLENDGQHYLGGIVDVYPVGSDFLLSDKDNCKLYLYGSNGNYLLQFGRKGRGPGEFIAVNNVQVFDRKVVVFAHPRRIYTYNLDGTLLSMRETSYLGAQSRMIEDGLLTYHGHVNQENRLEYYQGDTLVCEFLPERKHVLYYSSGADVFFSSGSGVVVVDSYSNTIFRFHEAQCEPYLTFDMGSFSIPKEFYDFSDVGEGAMFLLSRPFALINRYLESPSIQFVEILARKSDEKNSMIYGFKTVSNWRWVTLPDTFNRSVRFLEDSTLVCVVSPEKIIKMDGTLRNKVTNPEVLENISPEDNYVIAKITLDLSTINFGKY